MSKNKDKSGVSDKPGSYVHDQDAVQRPDVGVQPEFDVRKPPKSYRYDSSLAPELSWDESAARRWVDAVNQDGSYGLWAYEVVKDTTELPLVTDKYSAAKWNADGNMELLSQ